MTEGHPRPATLLRHALGELDAEARLAVEEHVSGCASCAARLAAERAVDEALLSTEPAPPAPGQGRAAFGRLWADVDARRAPGAGSDVATATASRAPALRPGLRPGVRWAAAAVFLVAVGLAVWALVSRPPEVAPPATLAEAPTRAPAGAPPSASNVLSHPLGQPAVRDFQPESVGEAPKAPRGEARDEAVDVKRLAAVRARLAEILVEADELFPVDDVRFAAVCSAAFAPLRAEGWSLTHLLRGQVLTGTGVESDAALRFCVLDPGSSSTLVALLQRPDRADAVLERLALQPFDLTAAPDLAHALERLADRRLDDPLESERVRDEEFEALVALLDRPGGRSALASLLESAVTRALRSPPRSPAVRRAHAVLTRCEAPAQVAALVRLATDPRHEPLATRTFHDLAVFDRAAVAAAAAERLIQERQNQMGTRPGDAALLVWCHVESLVEVADALVARLDRDVSDVSLLEATSALAGADQVVALFDVWIEHRLRPEGADVLDVLAQVLLREPDAPRRLAAAVRPSQFEDLVALAERTVPHVSGQLLLATLAQQGPEQDRAGWRGYLLTSLARLGDASACDDVLAWIGQAEAAADQALLPLAWATAQHLDGDDARLAWAAAGRDPLVLLRAAEDRGAWPTQADRLPRHVLRGLDRSLSAPEGKESL